MEFLNLDYIIRRWPPSTELLVGLSGSLKNYLPESLYEPLERVPNTEQLTEVRDHLVSLLRVVKTYVPYPVSIATLPAPSSRSRTGPKFSTGLRSLLPRQPQDTDGGRGGKSSPPPLFSSISREMRQTSGHLAYGSFLFVDIKGFTTLYEKMMARDDEGAEQVTGIINDMFESLLCVLFEHGGSLLRFGGDALLGLFAVTGPDALTLPALHAIQASQVMQAVMQQYSCIDVGDDEEVALRLKAGISTGPYFSTHLSLPKNMVFATMGVTVNRAEKAEGYGEAGETILDQATVDRVSDQIDCLQRDEGFYLLQTCHAQVETVDLAERYIAEDDEPSGDVMNQIKFLLQRLENLAPYLPSNILQRIVNAPDQVTIVPDYRPVTVLFVNYAGFGELIELLGETEPETIAQHLHNYYALVARIVTDYDGSISRLDQYEVGDRLVIFFGAPNAHEDDPLRAVYAAMEIQEQTRIFFKSTKLPVEFRQRIGINTGQLLAGNVGAAAMRQEYTLMGDDINMAARLMSSADWGEVLVSNRTQEHVTDWFELEDRGEYQVKGKSIPIHTYEVLGIRDYLSVLRREWMINLTGRDDELAEMLACGNALLEGRGQIVTITGDIGLGKSRLLREFRSQIEPHVEERSLRWIEQVAYDYRSQGSFWLFSQILLGLLGDEDRELDPGSLRALWRLGVDMFGDTVAREVVPFLAYLTQPNLAGRWGDWVRELPPGVRTRQIFWAARQFFAHLASKAPLIIAIDNFQWADEASLGLIRELLEITDELPLMFIFAFREPQAGPVCTLIDHICHLYEHRLTELDLSPIVNEASLELLGRLAPGAEFTDEVMQQILAKSLGNPRYLNEIVHTLIEKNVLGKHEDEDDQWMIEQQIDEIPLPMSLQSTLVARIDEFQEETRSALRAAAVLGQRFTVNMIRFLLEMDEETSNDWLSELERARIVQLVERVDEDDAADGESEELYEFLDNLVQQVAYQTLLIQHRSELHRRVGELLETRSDMSNLDELAFHYSRSDAIGKAINYSRQAGQQAMEEAAAERAVYHYKTLLDLLDKAEDVDGETAETRLEILDRLQHTYDLLDDEEARAEILEEMAELLRDVADDEESN